MDSSGGSALYSKTASFLLDDRVASGKRGLHCHPKHGKFQHAIEIDTQAGSLSDLGNLMNRPLVEIGGLWPRTLGRALTKQRSGGRFDQIIGVC